jgi:hypothetical protein
MDLGRPNPAAPRTYAQSDMLQRATLVVLVFAALVALFLAFGRGRGFEPTYVPSTNPAQTAVSGTVVDGSGKPQAGIAVTWFAHRGGGAYQGGDHVLSGPDGSFTLVGLTPGEGYVATSHETPLFEGRVRSFEARRGMDARDVVLRIEEVPLGRRISGRVLRADGTLATRVAVRGARSSLRGSWSAMATTDDRGEFVLVAPWSGGEAELELLGVGATSPIGTVEVGSAGIELRAP